MDALELLRRPEGKTLELKRELGSPDRFLHTVVAFANTAGGTVLIGVEDGSRRIVGVEQPLVLEDRIASLISDSISPRVLPDIEVLSYRKTNLVAVRIHPSPLRPHFIKRVGPERGTYVRVGSTDRLADEPLRAEMQRYSNGETFDERPLPDFDSEALDFRLASESFAPVRRISRRHLETLGLVTSYQGRRVVTVGGMLLFGRGRLAPFPDAWIQAGRFAGVDRTTIVDHAELREPPLQAIDQAVAFIEKHAMRGVVIGRLRREDRWNLPPAAVRELVVNAVVHADYSQRGAPIRVAVFDGRLEVENPGLLPFGLTLEDLPHGVSKLRNRVIGRVFHELGLIEQWGSGIQRILSVCRDAGLPEPTWEEIGIRLRATLRTTRVAEVTLDETDATILSALEASDGLGTREIAAAIGLTSRATRSRLADLVTRGLVRDIGTGPNDPKRRYLRTRA